MEYIKQKQILEDVNYLCIHLYRKWNKNIEFDSISSEALFWVSGRMEKLIADREKNIKKYRSYISTSITREIDRYAREVIVEKANIRNNRFTFWKVKAALLNEEKWAMEQIDKCCTLRQAKIMLRIISGEKIDAIANDLKISKSTVNYHFRAGIENIVVKNYLEFLNIIDPNIDED